MPKLIIFKELLSLFLAIAEAIVVSSFKHNHYGNEWKMIFFVQTHVYFLLQK